MPEERCVTKCAVHGRLWHPGEVREIDRFDEDRNPIVTRHFRLVEDDEVVASGEKYDPQELEAKRVEANGRDREAAIRAALDRLDPEEKRHWTRSGLPSLQTLSVDTGLNLTRGEVHSIAPDFDQEAARRLKAS